VSYDAAYTAGYGQGPSIITLRRDRNGLWHANSSKPQAHGSGDSSFEALGDLLERVAAQRVQSNA